MSHHAKLERAWAHLKAFEADMNAFIDADPYRDVCEQHARPGGLILLVVHWQKRQELPERLPFHVGDALYNLRSSLDHLAYALSVAHTGPGINERACAFPIHLSATTFTDKGRRDTRQMAPAVQTLLEGLQPYHAGDAAADHPLAVLDLLGNIDKHRRLVFTTSASVQTTVDLAPGCRDVIQVARSTEIRTGPFDDQTDVARLLVRQTGPNPNVQLEAKISIDVTFPEPGPAAGHLVVDELVGIYAHIRERVFPMLEPYLIGGAL